MTQEQLAEACGISIWSLRGYEQNRREPGWKGAIQMPRALDIAVEAFADCTSLHDDERRRGAAIGNTGAHRWVLADAIVEHDPLQRAPA